MDHNLDLNIQAIEDFLIRIESLELIKEDIKRYHPDDPRYIDYWRSIKKKCIEGFWIPQFGKWRFVPGRLYFYANFCTILDVNEVENTRIKIKPDVRDIEWIRSYMVQVQEGFSGWDGDDKYTSDVLVLPEKKEILDIIEQTKPQRFEKLLNKHGELKTYKDPWQNMIELKDSPMGRQIYWNDAGNIIEMGARGGGKSYYYSLAVAKYEICFNSLKYYTEESITDPPQAEVCIGSGSTSKSAEFCKKVEDSMNELAINDKHGAWGKVGDDDYVPSPLYKEMAGSLKPNNKENLWRHEYLVNSNGTWVKKGSKSYISHVVYSTQKKEGAQAAAGGRYGKAIIEEIGLTELAEEVFNSNKASVAIEGNQFGSQIGLGTSGNMETIIPAKKWFLNPITFDTLAFDDIYENSGKIGFFLPAFLTARQFKDKNGNTNVRAAVDYYKRRRQKYLDNKDSKGLEGEMMNYPIKPSEMFMSSRASRLPVPELMDYYRELTLHQKFHEYATVGELVFSSNKAGVKFNPDTTNRLQAITQFPVPKGYSQEGAVVIYEHPIETREGVVPDFLYVIGHDPIAKDHTTSEGSLSSIFVLKTALDPLKYGYYELVAEYIGRPYNGREEVNEILEKMAMYYGGTPGMIYFENQVGNTVEYFRKRNKIHLLATQPQRVFNPKGGWTKQITYGYPMSNKLIKDNAIDYLADWLKENRVLGQETVQEKNRMNLHYIKSPRLLSEFIQYNDKDNFDACFKKGTRVLTKKGYSLIEDIKKGDKVITQYSGEKEVVLTHKNQKNIVKVKVQGNDDYIYTTENHPFYIASNSKKTHKYRKDLNIKRFKAVKDLEINKDFALYPIIPATETYYTNEELYLMGWYLGDGYLNTRQNELKITYSLQEKDLAENMCKILDEIDSVYKSRLVKSKKGNYYRLKKSSKKIKDFLLKECHTTTFLNNTFHPDKYLNDKVYNSKNNFYFILGFLEAEGHKTKHKGDISINNTNIELLRMLKQMLINNRIYCTISKVIQKDNNKPQLCINIPYTYTERFRVSSKFNFEPNYKRKRVKYNAIEKEEGFYAPIIEVINTLENETVYNLSVIDDNTYYANEVLVHNCMGFIGCIIGIREKFNQYKQREKEEEILKRHNTIIDSFRNDDFVLSRRNNLNKDDKLWQRIS